MVALYLSNSKTMVKKINFLVIVIFIATNGLAQRDSLAKCEDFVGIITCESMPVFSGDLALFIKENILYPQTALTDSVEGKVFVSFWVDTLGNTVDHILVSGKRDDLNKEALRVTKLIKFEKPAMQQGKPIKIKYTIPVKFRIFP